MLASGTELVGETLYVKLLTEGGIMPVSEDLLRRYETIFFVGHARLPENITAKHVYDVFGLELEFDPRNNLIVDASCTAIPALGEKFLLDLLVGRNLAEGIDKIVEAIERRYNGPAQKAIITALLNAYDRYLRYEQERK